MNQEHGPDGSLMAQVHEMMNSNLSPGPRLDDISGVQLEHMSATINSLACRSVNLYTLLQHIFTMCNGYAIYGSEHIFVGNPSLERDFWDFEDGMLGLVVDILPWITARKAYLARKRVLKALIEYVKEERYRKASALIQQRIAINQSFGLSPEMIGHGELVLHFGILGNAVPTAFWLITNVFARRDLLQQLRQELESYLGIEAPSSTSLEQMESITKVISAKVVKSCPLLYSCYRETLRDISNASSPRLVLADTMLADQYLLRKNSILQIQGDMLHRDTSIWGADAASFDPERFLASKTESIDLEKSSPDQKRTAMPLPKGVPPTAFRSFGGGSTLCPGRHFAQLEVMTLVAGLILGFEIEAPDGGAMTVPAKNHTSTRLAMMTPVKKPQVVIKRRKGWENVTWDMVL